MLRCDPVPFASLASFKNTICDTSGTLSRVDCWNGGALRKDLVCFERFVAFEVGFSNRRGASCVECEERFRRFFCNDTTIIILLKGFPRLVNGVREQTL
jgi:hypothetical protein